MSCHSIPPVLWYGFIGNMSYRKNKIIEKGSHKIAYRERKCCGISELEYFMLLFVSFSFNHGIVYKYCAETCLKIFS
jgi:hypothetical protein